DLMRNALPFTQHAEQEMLGREREAALLAGLIPREEEHAPRRFRIALEHRSTRQLLQRLARQPEDPPLLHHLRAELLVEADCRRVPVEDGPLEAAAVASDRDPCELDQQTTADAEPPKLGPHEQILEIESAAADECREVVEEQGETCRSIACVRNEDLG